MKKLISMLLTVAVMFAMLVPTAAFADGDATTGSLTINDTTVGHTYEVYQIFTGTVDGKKLKDIKYGTGFKDRTAGDAATKDDIDTIASGVAEAEKVIGTVFRTVQSTAGSTVISDLPFGYYLVKETTTEENMPKGEAATSYIVQLVGDAELDVKAEVTTFDKDVYETNDLDSTDNKWAKVADYDRGDKVPFRLTATLPSEENFQYYEKYKLVFHDELSKGLTYDKTDSEEAIKIMCGNVDVTSCFTYDGTEKVEGSGQTFTLTCEDIKAAFKELGVELKGGESIVVTYKAELNDEALLGSTGNPNEAFVEFSNNPDNTGDGEPTEDTPKIKVIVFTFGVNANKVSTAGDKLVGATFRLEKKVTVDGKETWVKVGEDIVGDNTSLFSWAIVDAGTYRLTEVNPPTDYVAIDTIEFEIEPTYEDGSLTDLNGKAGDVFKGTVSTGIVESDIVNTPNKELPTTGGIGTTLFYVFGAILALGAAVLLIARRRADAR